MRKPRLDPKVIRSGDRVKIINPEVFVRCGYPLCKEDLKEELYKKYGRIIDSLLCSARNDKEFVLTDEPSSNLFEETKYNSEIINILASVQLVAKKFGGKERKIFTQRYDALKDKIFYVAGKRIVVTGEYVPGYGGGMFSEDCEPPYLTGVKTHKILLLDLCRKEIDEDFKTKHMRSNLWIKHQPVEIEAKNVEKLPDERELIQDKNGNWIKNPMYMVATK